MPLHSTHSVSPRPRGLQRPDILFVACQTENSSDGGLESSTKIFESLASRFGWVFVTTRKSAFTDRWVAGGAIVKVAWQLGGDTKIERALNYIALAYSILILVLGTRPKLIHTNDTKAFKATELIARLLQIPILVTIRDTKAPGERYDAPHWRRLATAAKRIVVLSSSMSSYLAENLDVPPERLRVINSIVDENWVSSLNDIDRIALRRRLGIAQKEFAVGVIGAVRPKKNQLGLLRYLQANSERLAPSSVLHFLGDFRPEQDMYSRNCLELAEGSNLTGRVVFHGHQAAMLDWYCALDAVVIASLNEGLARAMIEALACGTPVVSFDVSSAHEILTDSGAGSVVPQGDYEALFSALAALEADPDLRKAQSEVGRTMARSRFSSREVAQAYYSLYTEPLHN